MKSLKIDIFNHNGIETKDFNVDEYTTQKHLFNRDYKVKCLHSIKDLNYLKNLNFDFSYIKLSDDRTYPLSLYWFLNKFDNLFLNYSLPYQIKFSNDYHYILFYEGNNDVTILRLMNKCECNLYVLKGNVYQELLDKINE